MIPVVSLVLAAVIALVGYRLWSNEKKLHKFPGPWLARYTDLWQVWEFWMTHKNEPIRPYHDKYGPVVRMGPNKLYFSDPTVMRDIYGLKRDLKKSNYYTVSAPTAGGHVITNMFASTDTAYHDRIRRAVQLPFNTSSLGSYEEPIDDVIKSFLQQLQKRFVGRGGDEGIVDLSKWCHYFSLDSISTITYSKPYGFLEAGSDVQNMIAEIGSNLFYQSAVGQAPWLDKWLLKNPLLLWINRQGFLNHVSPPVFHALGAQGNRLKEKEEIKQGKAPAQEHYNDILEKLINAKNEKSDVLDDQEILKISLAVVFAGADSTAMLLAALFHYLTVTPHAYAALQKEVDALDLPISYPTAQKLPYLDAVIKETMRIFPVVRFTVERMTPENQSIEICGEQIPPNTIVGANPWAIHRNKEIFGEDVDTFRPERWLEDGGSSGEKYRRMAATLFLFGSGKFTCLGMNISNMEVHKFVPAFLKAFEIEQANPHDRSKDWKFKNGLFVVLKDVNVRVTPRIDVNEI